MLTHGHDCVGVDVVFGGRNVVSVFVCNVLADPGQKIAAGQGRKSDCQATKLESLLQLPKLHPDFLLR
ncbi:hypothetical protein D3C81_2106460 [compost metagenome]